MKLEDEVSGQHLLSLDFITNASRTDTKFDDVSTDIVFHEE
jgi:hypothetical protein